MGRLARTLLGILVAWLTWPATVSAEPRCGLEDPDIAASFPAIPERPRTSAAAWNEVGSVVRPDPVSVSIIDGALTGKTIYVSAGHGWTWLPNLDDWRTQRPNTHDLVEDLISTETIAYLLIPMLRNMGAYVVGVREADPNPNLVIVDDDSSGFSIEGTLSMNADGVGYGLPALPIVDDTNPFSAGSSLSSTATSSATGAAVWTFDVPEDGEYNVYIAYSQDPSRASDAHFSVRHPGGESHFRVDQRRHGSTWVLLGRFFFVRGAASDLGAVALYDDSSTPGATLSADVVRIGGGAGLIDRGGGELDRPMFEHNARYHAQLSGAPPAVYSTTGEDRNDDVGTRSRFAAWDHEDGEDAVYVAWHTNAPDPGRGTSSFAYGPSSFGPLSEFSGVPGSLELMDAVHSELIEDLRAVWDTEWSDRGQHTAFFGEVNPAHNPEMPSVLFELAFHDTLDDAAALREPEFRRIAARAIAHGIARYFAERDAAPLTLPPEAPVSPQMRQAGDGALALSWSAPAPDPAGGDAPDRYRVYLSEDGYSFDDGRDVAGTSYVITSPVDRAVFARVTAINAGGESPRSPLVGGRGSRTGAASVLVVDGFDDLDSRLARRDDFSDHDLGVVDRLLLDRMNDRSYVSRYGTAIDAFGASFDTASAEAVAAGAVGMASYRAVIWFAGEDAAPALDPARRALVSSYLGSGGRLFLSGADLLGSIDDELGATHVADGTGYEVRVEAGGLFFDLGPLSFADFGAGSYDAERPDVLAPADGAASELTYADGAVAATSLDNRVIVFGFPFETLLGEQTRVEVMARILSTFEIEPESPGTDSGGCGCRSGGQNQRGGLEFLLLAVAILARCRRRT